MRDLPSHWRWATLGDVAGYTNGRAFQEREWTTSGLPIVRIQNLNSASASFNYSSAEHEPRYKVRDGDVLVAWAASLGAYIWRGGDAWLNQHIFRVEPRLEIVDKQYLFYALKNSIQELYQKSRGSGIVHVTKGVFESHSILLPPLEDQKRIADKLDRLLAALDICKGRLDAIPAILKRFRQSVLAAATSGRLTEDWRSGSKTKSEWQDRRFGDLVINYDNRRVPIKLDDRRRRRGEYPYYGAFGVIDYIDDFTYDGRYLLVAEDGKNLESRDRPITNVATGKFWVNNHAHVVQARDGVELAFLQICLESPTLDLSSFLTGIDQVKLTRTAMDGLPVALPSLDEQIEIVRRVESLLAMAEKAIGRVDQARSRVEGLAENVLAKACLGELVPRHLLLQPGLEALDSNQSAVAAGRQSPDTLKSSGRKSA